MINDYIFKTPINELNLAEKVYRNFIYTCYSLLSPDFEAQKNDTLLFPGKMTKEELKSLPPTVIITSEYDIFRSHRL